jgi:hypothetical protein
VDDRHRVSAERNPPAACNPVKAPMLFHMVPDGPKPVAPFSHAVECDGWVFVTGQMPDSPGSPGILQEGIDAQTLWFRRLFVRSDWSEPP